MHEHFHCENIKQKKIKSSEKTIKRLISYIGASKHLLIVLLAVMLFITLLSLAGPALQGIAIDSITLKNKKLSVDFTRLITTLLILGGTYVISSLFTYIQGIFSAKLSLTTVRNMRMDLFSRLEYLPVSYIDFHKNGDIMSRMTNDVENISNTISQSIGSMFSCVLTIIGSLAFMLYYSPLLTLVTFITIPVTIFATTGIAKCTRKFFLDRQVILGQLNGHTEEMITGYKTVMAFGREKKAVNEFTEISNKLKKCSIKAQVFGGVMGPVMNVIGNLGFLIIAGFGGYLALNGAITVGTIQAFLLYSTQFSRPIDELANLYTQLQTAIAGAQRVFEIIDAPAETDDGKVRLKPESVKGNISFKHVYFSYKEGEPVLKDFNLEVKRGQKIAIVGATGAGKTTIVNLLMRFYESDSGNIKIDGIDICDIPKNDLRNNIAIVLQDTMLFSDTISSNIRYGKPDASDSDIKKAVKAANANVFIERFPESYETKLTEEGSNISQGQRQLISIARAVIADPKILILDEATSNVDTRTEMQIQKAMISLMKNRTSLIIAHRLSTIRDADMIIVIDGGKIAESGNHDELIARKGSYWSLYENQFAGIQI